MAELATIARPYAEALFKAAANDLNGTQAWLEKVAAVAADPQLLAFSANPKVTDVQVYDLIAGVAQVELPQLAANFLRTLIENGRLNALPEIASQFRNLKNSVGGLADAVVHSAFPLAAAELADIAATLEKRFGRKLNLQTQHDPELIGGVRVVVGDEVLDTSVKARLEQMKVALTA